MKLFLFVFVTKNFSILELSKLYMLKIFYHCFQKQWNPKKFGIWKNYPTHSKTKILWLIIKGNNLFILPHGQNMYSSTSNEYVNKNHLVLMLNDVNAQFDLGKEMNCWLRKDVTHWNGMPLLKQSKCKNCF